MIIFTHTNRTLLNASVLLLRIAVGVILFVAGSGKVLGWFGGQGLPATIQLFTTKMGIPAPLAYLSCFTEFVGGFLLIVGFFTRPAAFAVMINMLVATLVMIPKGFAMGAAFPFSLLMMDIAILLAGPLSYSLDSCFFS